MHLPDAGSVFGMLYNECSTEWLQAANAASSTGARAAPSLKLPHETRAQPRKPAAQSISEVTRDGSARPSRRRREHGRSDSALA
jgi:hypothetical protein